MQEVVRRRLHRSGRSSALLLLVIALGCGEASPERMRDGGLVDAAPAADGSVDAAGDAGARETCQDPPEQTSLALAFSGERDGGIDDFAGFGPEGPWVFAYRYESGDTQEIRGLFTDGTSDFGVTTVGVSSEREVRLGAPKVVRRTDRQEVAIAWDRTTFDNEGRATASEIRGVALDESGAPQGASNTMYQAAASPRIAANGDEGFWLLRSDVAFQPLTTLMPRLQRLDASFVPSGPDLGFTAFQIPPEAIELSLKTTPGGVAFAYRVAPSTLFAVPYRADIGVGAAQRTFSVPSVDDFTVAPNGTMAVVATETLAGSATVMVVVLDSLGREQGRANLDSIDGVTSAVHGAVAATSRGFAVVWRGTEGPAAELRIATVDFQGAVVSPKQALADVPFLEGELFVEDSEPRVVVGYQSQSLSGEQRLGLVRACLP